MTLNNRVGKISISANVPASLIRKVHEMLFIIEKDYSFYRKTIDLIAIHDSFREALPEEEIPEYRVFVAELDHIHMQGLFIYFEEIT